jgi:hypothetical protein
MLAVCKTPRLGEAMILIFALGILLGILAGGAICVRYLRHEIAADIGPQLHRMQNQLDTIEATVNLALMTRYSELSAGPPRPPALPAPRSSGE